MRTIECYIPCKADTVPDMTHQINCLLAQTIALPWAGTKAAEDTFCISAYRSVRVIICIGCERLLQFPGSLKASALGWFEWQW